ncbi:hypothetical protein BDV24DRAFT_175256 [Aspergillus arachidicola]|uniref:Nucleoside phosphorylase domain-containing protein n=1 Tax=Aspergillus arachidicola TaxID=656916 RepID=A0A5N6Y519_9EURO|nr:hypothetical protein BDV24DRAFT_175256 [Aspergillus arachidicola]
MSSPRPTKRARANLTGDAHVTHLTQDSTAQPANGKINYEEVLRLVDQLGHGQLCDIVTKAAKAHSDVATDIHNTIEEMREKERNRVINFDPVSKNVWHDINVVHRKLEGSQQYDVAGDVWYDTVDTIDSIVHRCGPFTSLQTRLNGLSALCRIGKTICLSDSGVVGHEVRKQCQGDHCLEEAMIEILSTMSEGDRRAIWEENSSEEALWPKLLELNDLADDLCLFERFNEVLDLIDPPREVDDASDGEDSEDEEGSEYFGEEGEDEEEENSDKKDVQDYDNPANQPWITDSSNANDREVSELQSQFGVGIICALPLEATAVSALFDTEWDSHPYSKAVGDTNAYSTGSIGRHNVVLVHMAGMGKIAAATAAANLRASFEGVQLAIVVGICGAIPHRKQPDMEIHLGDVIISEGLVQYDFGRRYSSNQFARKDTPRDNLPRPSPEIRAGLAKLQVEQGRRALHERTLWHLSDLREKLYGIATYPGATEDKLFEPIYRHKHHVAWACVDCVKNDDVCDSAIKLTCDHLQCDESNLVPRQRLSEPFKPAIHFGLIASGDTVMKSGVDRDSIAARDQVIAFEMEGAGVWELFRSVLVIKAACDYADSHKSKNWQGYAAATAAAATKGFFVVPATRYRLRSNKKLGTETERDQFSKEPSKVALSRSQRPKP